LSGVASLEQTTESNESDAGHINSAGAKEGHVHSNRMIADFAV
jgi:hypothetical protein